MMDFSLNGFLRFVQRVYHLGDLFKKIPDPREKILLRKEDILMVVFVGFLIGIDSFYHYLYRPTGLGKKALRRLKRLVKGTIPGHTGVRRFLSKLDPADVEELNNQVIEKAQRNGFFRRICNLIDGFRVLALDGNELSKSKKKNPCDNCQQRELSNGDIEYFHRIVVGAIVGSKSRIVVGAEWLTRDDSADKNEAELTGGIRLIEKIKKRFGHIADVVVGDALYCNAPFINRVNELGFDCVVRLKDESLNVFKSAEKMVNNGWYHRRTFKVSKGSVEAYELDQKVRMKGVGDVRVVCFKESFPTKTKRFWRVGKEIKSVDEVIEPKPIWVVTTNDTIPVETLYKMIKARWDIEEVFSELTLYYRIDRTFCHNAAATILFLQLLAYNTSKLYIMVFRGHHFMKCGATFKMIREMWWDDALDSEDNLPDCLYGSASEAGG